MGKKALYLGSEDVAYGSLPARTAGGEAVDVFATTALDVAMRELVRTDFAWLIVDHPADERAIRLLRGTAEIDGNGGPTVWVHERVAQRTEWAERIVDGTFDSIEDLTLRTTSKTTGETSDDVAPAHPVLSTLPRDDGGRVLAHIDRDGTYRWTNSTFASLLDRPREAIVGQTIEDVRPPGIDDGELSSILPRVLETRDPQWIGTGDAGPVGIYCLHPIDERSVLLFSDATQAGVAFGDQYLDQIQDLIFIVDVDGNLHYWNDRLTQVTGYSDVELLDMNALELFPPDVRADANERLRSVARLGEGTVELPIVRKDGERVPYQFSGSLVKDADGSPRFVCGIGRDISERVEMRGEIEEAVEKLEESNAELERFASVASHDLREPLRAVRSYLELLDSRYADELDDDAREFIDFAVNGAERMQSMIEDLLEYSRIGSSVRRERVDCVEVLEEVRDNLAVSIEESNAAIRDEDLPVVTADRTLMVQLFQNLIDNAIQHTDSPAPDVHLSAERTGDSWRFAVRDNGPGIPEEDLEDIFEMFSTRNEENGLGIGLATCRKIVEALGGDIDVQSSVGEGSTFYFTLPASEDVEER